MSETVCGPRVEALNDKIRALWLRQDELTAPATPGDLVLPARLQLVAGSDLLEPVVAGSLGASFRATFLSSRDGGRTWTATVLRISGGRCRRWMYWTASGGGSSAGARWWRPPTRAATGSRPGDGPDSRPDGRADHLDHSRARNRVRPELRPGQDPSRHVRVPPAAADAGRRTHVGAGDPGRGLRGRYVLRLSSCLNRLLNSLRRASASSRPASRPCVPRGSREPAPAGSPGERV